jgi:hypothetical protein
MGKLSLANLKTTRDFNNVLDSYANHVDGAGGANTPLINYIKFATGDYFGLAIATKSDANSRAGFELAANTLTENAVDGGTGASAITLPAAEVGTLCVHRFTAQADGGQDITFTTKGTDTFEAGTLNTDVRDLGDSVVGRRVFVSSAVETVATFGGAIVTVAGTHNIFTIATTATNNQTNKGAEVSFYCSADKKWRIAFLPSELGTGAINGTFATS